jgi:hypothetical protein
MSKWKQWHLELNEAIEKPTRFQKKQMDETHFELYRIAQEIQTKKEELELLTEEFKDIKDTLNQNNLPDWAWIWYKKQSRVAWKQVVIDRLGQTYANKISANQAQKKYSQVGIQFIDPNPDQIPIDPNKKKQQEKPKRFKLAKQTRTPLLKLKIG